MRPHQALTARERRTAPRHTDRAVQAADGEVVAAVEGACRRPGTPIEVPFGY